MKHFRKFPKTITGKTEKQIVNDFTFKNYKEFCRDFRIKESDYNNLKKFKMYCRGRYEVLFSLL